MRNYFWQRPVTTFRVNRLPGGRLAVNLRTVDYLQLVALTTVSWSIALKSY